MGEKRKWSSSLTSVISPVPAKSSAVKRPPKPPPIIRILACSSVIRSLWTCKIFARQILSDKVYGRTVQGKHVVSQHCLLRQDRGPSPTVRKGSGPNLD